MDIIQIPEAVAALVALGAAVIGVIQYTIRITKASDKRRLEIFDQLEQSKLDNASMLIEINKLETEVSTLKQKIEQLTLAIEGLVAGQRKLEAERDEARMVARELYRKHYQK